MDILNTFPSPDCTKCFKNDRAMIVQTGGNDEGNRLFFLFLQTKSSNLVTTLSKLSISNPEHALRLSLPKQYCKN